MPALTAVIIWGWMFDTQFGVVNYVLTQLTSTDFTGFEKLNVLLGLGNALTGTRIGRTGASPR